jgi:hypothetical protein
MLIGVFVGGLSATFLVSELRRALGGPPAKH